MIKANPRVTEYLTEICYHRYGNPTEQFLPGILAVAQAHGWKTSMGEWLKPDYIILPYQALHNDLTQCNVSSWQQYTLGAPGAKDGRGYFAGSTSSTSAPVPCGSKLPRMIQPWRRWPSSTKTADTPSLSNRMAKQHLPSRGCRLGHTAACIPPVRNTPRDFRM